MADNFPYVTPFTNDTGHVTQEAMVWMEELIAALPITGEGNPENNIAALKGKVYYDVNASSGSMAYVKTQDNINGDSKKGWQLA